MHAARAFVCFYGERSPFSQFYAATVFIDGITFPTAEHAFQRSKGRINPSKANLALQERILQAPTPSVAKQLGRQIDLGVQGREDWHESKMSAAIAINLCKFMQHAELPMLLVSTGNRALVEASPTDSEWSSACAARYAFTTHHSRARNISILACN
ncbi:hypothetical protein F5Y10DRAFT_272213 [Nemania abortiva]|nr:hypothetical protein F5Y10DRAFT_272213 [Nemania abortiva]